jgi:hypothetical protein
VDDLTLGELARALARIEDRQKEQATQYVPMQVYTLQHATMQAEIAELKGEIAATREAHGSEVESVRAEVRAETRQRIADRRWWLTAIGIPVASLILQYLAPLIGGGS